MQPREDNHGVQYTFFFGKLFTVRLLLSTLPGDITFPKKQEFNKNKTNYKIQCVTGYNAIPVSAFMYTRICHVQYTYLNINTL